MSQKDYKMEIIDNLLKKENHVRGLAKDLNSNQTTIARKLNDLYESNVVDYREEGKNKTCFLKKSIESKQYIYMTEHYKLLKLIEKYPSLRKIITKIQENEKIKLAVLFGSYAKNRAEKNSDIDIFLHTKNRELKKETEIIDSRAEVKIGDYNKKNNLIKEIEKNHVIIKGVETYYEKNKFFK